MTTMTRRRNVRITSALLLLLTSLFLSVHRTEARIPSYETKESNTGNNLRGSRTDAYITAAIGLTTNLSEVEGYNEERDQALVEERQRALQERVARRRAAQRLQKQKQREHQEGQLLIGQKQQPPTLNEDNGRIQSIQSFMEKYNERHSRARMYFDTSEEAEHAHTLAASGKVDDLQLFLEGASDIKIDDAEEEVEDRYHLLHSRDNDGWTLLHEAIFQQNADVVEYLLTLDEVLYASSDSDDDDDDDSTSKTRRDDDLLNAMNFQGQTPLDLALEIAGSDADNKIVHLMIVNGSTLPPLLLAEDTNREKKAIKFVQRRTKEDYPIQLDRHR